MADIRIKDLATTATTTASDDFMAVDGVTNGTRKLSAATPAFLTSVTTPSLTAPASTDLTLAGGSSGASLVLGQGSSATSLVGTGNVKIGFNAASGVLATFGVSSGNAGDGTYLQIRGKDEVSSEGWAQLVLNSSNAAVSSGSFQINQFNGASFNEVLRTTKLRNLLIGTTTDMSGSGGLKVAGTTASTSTTTGALQVAGGAGFVGSVFGNSFYATNIISAGDGVTLSGILGANSSSNVSNLFLSRSDYSWGLNNEGDLRFYLNTSRTLLPGTGGVNVMQVLAGSGTLATAGVNISSTKSATTSTTGALTVGNGTAATNVAIGGGNIYAGGTGTFGGVLSTTGGSDLFQLNATSGNGVYLTLKNSGTVFGYIGDAGSLITSYSANSGTLGFRSQGAISWATAGATEKMSLSTGGALVVTGTVSTTNSTASTGVGTGALQVAGGIYAGAASVFGGVVTVQNSGYHLKTANTNNMAAIFGYSDAGTTNAWKIAYDATNLQIGANANVPVEIVSNNVRAALFSPTAATFAGAVTIAGTVIHTLSATPASASATGTVGTMSWDASYIYICTAANTWKRVAIATW